MLPLEKQVSHEYCYHNDITWHTVQYCLMSKLIGTIFYLHLQHNVPISTYTKPITCTYLVPRACCKSINTKGSFHYENTRHLHDTRCLQVWVMLNGDGVDEVLLHPHTVPVSPRVVTITRIFQNSVYSL